ncbi:DUF4097 family beta strand repeat-containing protein [Hymenobacter algoricola]|uniref:DUF4097 domain-containing protein n=1 Tax=Hymenobacter algoricola TaxID=486267 RepID=A0ABP7MRW1_9BACT
MKNLVTACLLGLTTLSAAAQTAPVFSSTCDDRSRTSGNTSKTYCEIRDLTLASPGSQTLTIDGGANGGITVKGWDGSDVRVRANVTSWGQTEAAASQQARSISIATTGNTLRAAGPDQSGPGWAVSYEVFVPRRTALALTTINGGISLSNLDSRVRFEAVNGGVSLTGVSGQIKGHTTNGGLSIRLTGTKWEGEGLDVETTNGGITWELPKNYSAKLFTSTNMGSIAANLPVTKSGFTHKEIATSLGQGGASVRAVTTNGGIRVKQE